MRDVLTTVSEIAGAACVTVGLYLVFGIGVALMAAGLALIGLGYLASGGAE